MTRFIEHKENYSLVVEKLQSPDLLNTGLWMVLAGINEIPPHIALINNGKYYSISARKIEVGEPIEKFLKAISRRTLPTVFVGIKPGNEDIEQELREAFSHYPTLGNGEHSCLWPVRDFFAKAFSPEYASCSLVFELLAITQQQGLLIDCKALFDEGDGSQLSLPKYSVAQIREKINSILTLKN